MGHSVTIGGDRLGSGNKNKTYLHNYERSTHNLAQKFSSTMGVGMLVPFMCELVTRDDKYEIDLSAGLRTIPTKGPLFGSFKLQVDVFVCPRRLYQALLHNNPLAIGLKANQVKWPKMRLYAHVHKNGNNFLPEMSATNSLVKYLGLSGIGTPEGGLEAGDLLYRDIIADPLLAYYDIFKNYYANKQEEQAYTLESVNVYEDISRFTSFFWTSNYTQEDGQQLPTFKSLDKKNGTIYFYPKDKNGNYIEMSEDEVKEHVTVTIKHTYPDTDPYEETYKIGQWLGGSYMTNLQPRKLDNKYNGWSVELVTSYNGENNYEDFHIISASFKVEATFGETETNLKAFNLSDIDDMRMQLLSFHQLGQYYLLDGRANIQGCYYAAIGDDDESYHAWQKPLAGLCVKTYQSDLYNNWVNTEWIDGDNGIAAITAISTQQGSISIDALNFSQKLYNLLNRIAVSGATYEDYLDAAYTDSAKKFCESPMWVGGLSDEIVFEEIVQTAPADGDPLGSLAGRGNLLGKRKGGKITVKIDEPSFIIGIVSITPRINYTQGNAFYLTDVESLQDIHVPALDGIAFQNLIGERLHAGSTRVNDDGTIEERPVIGKIPAWLEYMTAVDKAYGDFAETGGDGYMILQRDYNLENGEITDATTYIDPAKFNYAFAYTKRDAQNFWVQIRSDIKARRLMSGKQIPNV